MGEEEEEEEECVVVHAKKAGFVLREGTLQRWKEEGQKRWFGERVVAVKVRGRHLVAAYQPIWGMNEEGMERYRRNLASR